MKSLIMQNGSIRLFLLLLFIVTTTWLGETDICFNQTSLTAISTTTPINSIQLPKTINKPIEANIPEGWQAKIEQSIERQEYEITWQPDFNTFSSPNRAQNLRFQYQKDGFSVAPREASRWSINIKLLAFGKDTLQDFEGQSVTINRNKAESKGVNLTITYENQRGGMRQNFIVHEKPQGDKNLTLEFAAESSLAFDVDTDKHGLTFSENNQPVYYYNGLYVTDANGTVLEASMHKANNGFFIEVEDENAVYPVLVDPLSTTPNWLNQADQASAKYGTSIVPAGDINNDGYADVIVGAPFYDNGQTDEGRVFGYYGSSSGLPLPSSWDAESNQAAAEFGTSLAAGDFNGDGKIDVAIGAPQYDAGAGPTKEGGAFIYLNSGSGLPSTPSSTLSGDANSNFGYAVASCNVNSDAYDDLLVGAYLNSQPQSLEGRLYVFHGTGTGIPINIPNSQHETDVAGDYFAYSVSSAGDVNNDGYDDVIIGSFASNGTGLGSAYVFHGSVSGLSGSPSWSITSAQTADKFGSSVSAAGDVNGDGYDDVIVGAYGYDNGQTDEGRAYVYHGSASGLNTSPNWTVESNQASAQFGISVSNAGDVNADGYSDVIVGANLFDNGQTDEGRAYIYAGSSTGLSTSPIWTGESNSASAQFGFSVASAGDVNNDGLIDIIAGAPGFTSGQSTEGGAYAFYGLALFTNQTATRLSGVSNVVSGTSTFADYDSDGDMDLLIAGDNTAGLWRNNGSGTFTNITASAITTPLGYLIDARLNSESAWGDFDGDGDLDLLYGGEEEFNTTNQRSWLLRNDGGSQFSDATPGGFPGVQDGTFNWVDFDNDGDLDIALHGFTGSGPLVVTQLWENTGAGFSNETLAFAPGGITPIWLGEMRWADFDNDGDQDFLIAGTDDGGIQRIRLYRNGTTGAIGTFTLYADFGSDADSFGSKTSIAWGDYDGDGDPDFVTSFYEDPVDYRTKIYRNNAGSFVDVTATAAPGLPQVGEGRVGWADYDNDGDLDLMITGVDIGNTQYTQLWRNASGVFSYHASALTGIPGLTQTAFAWADVDLDADLDLVISGYDGTSSHSQLWINGSATGNLAPSVPSGLSAGVSGSDVTLNWLASTDATTPTASLTYNVYVGTASQSEDIVSANANILSGFRRISTAGNAGFGSSFSIYGLPSGTYFWSVQAIDNGFVGSAFASEGTFTIGGGSFTNQSGIAPLLNLSYSSVAWGDYDNDDDLDLVLTGENSSNPNTQLLNNNWGGGVFTDQTGTVLPGITAFSRSSVAWADYDNDGDLDLLLAGGDATKDTQIWRNGTTGASGPFSNQTATVAPGLTQVSRGDVAWADYDNDGDQDFLLIGYGVSALVSQIWRNGTSGTSGTFTDQTATIAPGLPGIIGSIAWGDYDNDGDLDIILAGLNNVSLPVTQIWRNGTTGAPGIFTDQSSTIAPGLPGITGSIAWGDYDNDGDLDLILISLGSTQIWRNGTTGASGIFTDQSSTIAPGLPALSGSGVWADYDNDGDLDILLTGSGASPTPVITAIWRNGTTGATGVFTDQTMTLASGLPYFYDSSVAWGDYDRDGDLDFVITGSVSPVSELSQIWRNELAANSAPGSPTGLSSVITGQDAQLTWSSPVDNTTPSQALTYNVRVGTTPGGFDIVSPGSNVSTGFRRLPAYGNAQLGTTYELYNLPSGTYYWSVQAIDNGFVGSTFAAEGTFTISGGIFTNVTATLAPGLPGNLGGSASWGDYDNDNDLDLLILGTGFSGNVTQIWRNGTTGSSGTFTDQTATLAPGLPQLYNYEADWGDYDNDGDLDLIFAARDNSLNSVSAIWRNGTTGTTGTFTDVTSSIAPGLPPTSLGGVQWGDYDNDGDLDFVMIGYNTFSTQYLAQIWRNGTTGSSGIFSDQTSTISPGLPTFVNGSVKWVDFDKDNDLDLFITGDNGGPLISQLWRNGNTGSSGVFTNFFNFGGLHYSDQSWGDYDNDGDLDLLLFGSNGGTWVTYIYRNENGISFNEVTGTVAPGISGTSNGSANWIDYDNDGDLDLQINGNNAGLIFEIWENGGGTFSNVTSSLISGVALASNSTVNWADFNNDSKIDFYISGYDGVSYFAQLWQNGTLSANANPTVPTGLSASVTGSSVTLSWNASTDGTPSNALSYNVRVGTGAGLADIVAPNANISSGYFKLAEIGNAQLGTSFKLENLAAGTYYWSVQAIDNGFMGSTFAAEGTFTISGGGWVGSTAGYGNEYATDVVVDGLGNVFSTGHFYDNGDFNPSAGTQNLISSGKADIFLIKQSSAGAFNWVVRIGGTEEEYATSIAADGSGNAIVAGHFSGTTDISTFSFTSAGSTDGFVAKYNSSGGLAWAKTFGGMGAESATAVAADNSGNVYVAGHFSGTASFSGTNLTAVGETDLFIVKYNSVGGFLWARQYGGTGNETVNKLAVDPSGNIYATGGFTGSTNFDGSSQSANGLTDAYIVKLNTNGDIIWLNKAGSSGHDRGWGIAVDGGGNVYATGEFSGTMGSLTANGGYDAWVVKFNSGGGQLWAIKAGGNENDMGFGVSVDGSGNVYVVGGFKGSNAPFGGFNLTAYGSYDGFIFKTDNSGSVLQAERVGGGGYDYCKAVSFGSTSLLITGYFEGNGALFTPASLTPVNAASGYDSFIFRASN